MAQLRCRSISRFSILILAFYTISISDVIPGNKADLCRINHQTQTAQHPEIISDLLKIYRACEDGGKLIETILIGAMIADHPNFSDQFDKSLKKDIYSLSYSAIIFGEPGYAEIISHQFYVEFKKRNAFYLANMLNIMRGASLIDLERYSEGEQLISQALIYFGGVDRNIPDFLKLFALKYQATAALKQGRLEEAHRYLKRIGNDPTAYDIAPSEWISIQILRAKVFRATGDAYRARVEIGEITDFIIANKSDIGGTAVYFLSDLFEIMFQFDSSDSARPLLTKMKESLRKGDSSRIGRYSFAYWLRGNGMLLLSQNKTKEALRDFRAAAEEFKKAFGEKSFNAAQLSRYIEILESKRI